MRSWVDRNRHAPGSCHSPSRMSWSAGVMRTRAPRLAWRSCDPWLAPIVLRASSVCLRRTGTPRSLGSSCPADGGRGSGTPCPARSRPPPRPCDRPDRHRRSDAARGRCLPPRRPSRVRSPVASRSHCATEVSTFRTSLPTAVRVSIESETDIRAKRVAKYLSTRSPRSRSARGSFNTEPTWSSYASSLAARTSRRRPSTCMPGSRTHVGSWAGQRVGNEPASRFETNEDHRCFR